MSAGLRFKTVVVPLGVWVTVAPTTVRGFTDDAGLIVNSNCFATDTALFVASTVKVWFRTSRAHRRAVENAGVGIQLQPVGNAVADLVRWSRAVAADRDGLLVGRPATASVRLCVMKLGPLYGRG